MRPKLSALVVLAVTALPSIGASGERARLVAVLSGAGGPTGGDPDGSGRAEMTLDTARLSLCYALTATGIAPATGAHIHRGSSADTGRSVIRLLAPRNGESRAC